MRNERAGQIDKEDRRVDGREGVIRKRTGDCVTL